MSRNAPRARSGLWAALLVAALGLALVGWGVQTARSTPVAAAPDLRARPVLAAAPGLSAGPVPRPAAGPPLAVRPTRPAASVPSAVVLPHLLALPRQHVAAQVTPIGVTATRELDLPTDPKVVGWWAGGSPPGSATGSTVLAGHLDSARSGVGAMAALLEVKVGDPVEVSGDRVTLHFRVASRSTYRKAALPAQVFRPDGPAVLTLVTCGGPYDTRTHHYRDNVVVTALLTTGASISS